MALRFKNIKRQPDTGLSIVGTILWATEQGVQNIIGEEWWSKMPFLELAVIAGVFSLGRNWRTVWPWIKSWLSPIDCKTRVQDGKLYADLKFKRRCDNPAVDIRLYAHDEMAFGDPCRYALLGHVNRRPNASYNRGESLEIELLSKVANPLQPRTMPNHLLSSGEIFTRHQYRVLLELTHYSRWPFKRHWDVFVPSSRHLDYLIGTVGFPCIHDGSEVSNDKLREFLEVNE
jgi:hypothetical protein